MIHRRTMLALGLAGLAALSGATSACAVPGNEKTNMTSSGPDYRGESIRVRSFGAGSDVIMVPGRGSSGDVWLEIARRLAGRHRVHLVYIRGFAGEPANPSSKAVIDPIVADLHRYIGEKGLVQPAIVGHSLGGTISLALAARYPNDVERVLLVEAGSWMPQLIDPAATPDKMRQVADSDRQKLLALTPSEFLAVQSPITRNWTTDPDKQVLLLRWLELGDRETLANAGFDLYTTDLRPELPKIQAEVRLITGWWPRSPLPRDELLSRFADQFRNLEAIDTVVIDDSHHFVMFDQPKRLFAEIKRFLEEETVVQAPIAARAAK